MIAYDMHLSIFLIIIIILSCFSIIIYKIKKTHKYSIYGIILFEVYLLCLIKVVYLPIRMITDEKLKDIMPMGNDWNAIQIIPFKTLGEVIDANNQLVQIGGNIVLFMPFVFFIYYMFNERNKIKCIFISFMVILFVEITQLGIDVLTEYPNKVCDVDDVIVNMMGVILITIIINLLKNTRVEKQLVSFFTDNGAKLI